MTEPEVQETPAEPVEESKPDREAAKYRTQLREAEKERDQYRDQVRALQRAELDRLATTGSGARLHRAADIWGDDTDFSELVDELGRVDPDAVRGVVEAYTAGREYLRADLSHRRGDPSQGAGNDIPPAVPSWSAVINPQ